MEDYWLGKKDDKDSVGDDLESLLVDQKFQLGRKIGSWKHAYFLPKLTEAELELVERKDENYMETFYHGQVAVVEEAKMKVSESDSKFVLGTSYRKTFTIENFGRAKPKIGMMYVRHETEAKHILRAGIRKTPFANPLFKVNKNKY